MADWRLLQPIEVGRLTLKNRIAMPAMELGFSGDGQINQRHVDFYAERAAGGAALLIFGGCTIDRWAGGRQMISLR
ncbi:MAG: NADH:flavin oxidoreductase, partial [Deltaproteobacteria bacterium]|nr:NADH:flavin oxidoreductase [Deltaproteobacteria bacterium]